MQVTHKHNRSFSVTSMLDQHWGCHKSVQNLKDCNAGPTQKYLFQRLIPCSWHYSWPSIISINDLYDSKTEGSAEEPWDLTPIVKGKIKACNLITQQEKWFYLQTVDWEACHSQNAVICRKGTKPGTGLNETQISHIFVHSLNHSWSFPTQSWKTLTSKFLWGCRTLATSHTAQPAFHFPSFELAAANVPSLKHFVDRHLLSCQRHRTLRSAATFCSSHQCWHPWCPISRGTLFSSLIDAPVEQLSSQGTCSPSELDTLLYNGCRKHVPLHFIWRLWQNNSQLYIFLCF